MGSFEQRREMMIWRKRPSVPGLARQRRLNRLIQRGAFPPRWRRPSKLARLEFTKHSGRTLPLKMRPLFRVRASQRPGQGSLNARPSAQ